MTVEVAVHMRTTTETQDINSNIIIPSPFTRRITTITGNKIKTLRTKDLVMTPLNIIINRINNQIKISGSIIHSHSSTIAVEAAV